jgi:hypothetical protein
MFGAFIGKDGAFEVVGIKDILEPEDVCILPP